MFHPKVGSLFRALESQSRDIITELNSFMSGISDWADGLLETVEKEHTTENVFLIPKTPSKKNTRNRKPKNTGVSTTLPVETNDLDKTITSRRRTTRRGAKMNITRDVNLTETMQNTLVMEENKNVEKTVVLQANTRPVLRSKEPEVAVPEQETADVKNETNELNIPLGSSQRESPPEKVGTSEHISRSRKTRSCKSPRECFIDVIETPLSGRTRTSKTSSSIPLSSKKCGSLSSSPTRRSSSVIIHRTLSKSPVMRSRSLRSNMNASRSLANSTNKSMSNKNTVLSNQKDKHNTPELCSAMGNKVVKKELTPLAASTFIIGDETLVAEEITPVVKEGRISRFNKTLTRSIGIEKTYVVNAENGETNVAGGTSDLFASSNGDIFAEESTQDAERPKKKRKLKKNEEMKENIEEISDTMRITRTKSKALKEKMENASKQADLSTMAKKLVNKAKITKVRKSRLDTLLLESNLPCGNLSSSKSKYHLLVASSKEMKTPLGPLPYGMRKMAKTTADKYQSRPKVAGRDNSTESTTRSATKPLNPDLIKKEMQLKSKIEKEKNAELKRQNEIKNKQVELKRKNELKHQMAMKQREKLEQEKYHNMIQSEKEKEEKHKLLLEERRLKLKEEVFKKKMLTQQKIAETAERRRLEEEARIAKLKEMEEEQRLALEKQKEQERLEKRAQERLAEKKAREEYEMQQRQELEAERLRAGKVLNKKCLASGSKFQSASKRPKLEITAEKKEWDYKSRNEDDYGLEDENSEVDSEDENPYKNVKPPKDWAKKILQKKNHVVKHITLEMINEFMTCHRKSPDVNKMFEITPSKHIKRSSSAIWHTPSS